MNNNGNKYKNYSTNLFSKHSPAKSIQYPEKGSCSKGRSRSKSPIKSPKNYTVNCLSTNLADERVGVLPNLRTLPQKNQLYHYQKKG